MTLIPITLGQLEDLVHVRRGAQPVTILTRTVPDMRAKSDAGEPNPFRVGRGKTAEFLVRKHSTVNGIINFHYGNAVNRQRDREGLVADFEPKPRQWGVRRQVDRGDGTLVSSPVVDHTNKAGQAKVYLEIKVERAVVPPRYVHTVTGEPVEKSALEPWLSPERESSRQEVENEIILRDYDLANVLEIHLGGERYVVVDEKNKAA